MLSIDQLLLPISDTQSCGEDTYFSVEVDLIAQARMHDDPTLDQGEWVAALKEADWDFVAEHCAQMIAAKSKDLRLAVWLAEASAKTRGLRGLGDGYAVLAGLCDRFWDGMYPIADDGDYEQRIGNLFWLLSHTPALVRGAAAPTPADAEYCLAMLMALERVIDRRLGADGPGFSAARDVLQSTLRAIVPAGSAAALATTDAAAGAAAVSASGLLQSRQQALAQLRQVADFFRSTEPHSPVAYLADKAASWGEMPLHVWLRTVIKDPAAIAGIEDLLDAPAAGD
jgi:type VI secretion system protein ImpA